MLYIDRSRMLPKEDLTGSFILSAMMMLLESLSLVAANRKLRLESNIIYSGADEALMPFAELKLVPDENAVTEYADELILARRTSRLGYIKKDIPAASIQKLKLIAQTYGQEFGVTGLAAQIEKLLDHNIRALFHDLNDKNYHEEIESYFANRNRRFPVTN